MECINFDKHFQAYARAWMRANAAKYRGNVDRMEARMPDVYLQWLNRPADWLGGASPGAYFAAYDDAELLSRWMLDYFIQKIPVPDPLLERLAALGEAGESALLALLSDETAPEEARLTAISMLMEMESLSPMPLYIGWIASRAEQDERAEMAAEALAAMGRAVVQPVLAAVDGATEAGRETFLDILCNFPGEEATYALASRLFVMRPERRALMASFLGKLGDERALPLLLQAMQAPDLAYLDYIELRNAVEALGGEASIERDFSGDPHYESLRRME
ncbi:MAG: hypothetical protein LBM74_01180 [Oscillospiraceae bacterium]|jgi:HEAT repeat protein|nr:hypothetical protein [Oscillospiraceae bacterium]